MKPSVKDNYRNIVRIISHDIGFDWLLPFQRTNPSSSFGSGFFIDDKGHILTCSHCVDNASHIYVEIPSEGNKVYTVKLKGVCPLFDLAILQIENYKNKTYCELDDGNTVIEQGFETFAMGYPLGQNNMKITKGIISGQQYNFYQTDTPINPGNSGGPLLYNGKVIAINAAGPSQTSQGIGYSVPIKRFYSIKKMLFDPKIKLIHYPETFGFYSQPTTDDLKEYFKSKCDSGGILINNIINNSPIAKTKLKIGDILCTINDIPIDNFGGLSKKWMNESMSFENLVFDIGINNNVKIEYWRNGKQYKDTFKLKPFIPKIRLWYPVLEYIDYECIGGLVIMNLNVNLIMILLDKSHQLGSYMKGNNIMKERLIIVNIMMGAQVSKMEILSVGDVITKINDKKIKNLDEFRKQFY
jgi:S1-C subfamily serine protease